MTQAEKIALHNATQAAINRYRTRTLRRLMASPASLHVMMQALKD